MHVKTQYGFGDGTITAAQDRPSQDQIRLSVTWRKSGAITDLAILSPKEARELLLSIKAALREIEGRPLA